MLMDQPALLSFFFWGEGCNILDFCEMVVLGLIDPKHHASHILSSRHMGVFVH